MKVKTVTLRSVPEDAWRAAKIEAARQGITLTAFILSLIAQATVGKKES